jgi:hypothetical protein
MKTYHNKLVVCRYFEEVLLNGRIELIEELFAPEICDLVRRYAFFAPETFIINDVIAEGDTVMVRWHTPPFLGAQFDQNGFAVCYLEGGMIAGLEMMDCNGIMRQIGAEVFSPEFEISR